MKQPYIAPLEELVTSNTDFRRVLYTGDRSQLVTMDIKPGEEVGEETHKHVEQTLRIAAGSGVAVLNGKEQPVKTGDVIVVPPGTRHNVINRGDTSLKIATIYAPPNHIDGRVHKTPADAKADKEDEAFGEQVR
jgi:mannose-6-phosphate isomerase-like protein (cupin superfamily)